MPEPLRIRGATHGTLLGYLFGLGLLRVVARQADSAARACWRDGALELHSELDAAGLEQFLLERWVPAPVVSPWNGGSGFFPKDNVEAFTAIEADRSSRLEPLRAAIADARTALRNADLDARPEPRLAKPALLRQLRATLRDDAVEWLDAAIVLVGEGAAFPPVLGSGGNDGRYDVANNYAQALVFALAVGGDQRARRERSAALAEALWRMPAPLRAMSLAHLARDASPVNSPAGESDALGNPWQLALAIEGTLLLAAGAGRRLQDGASPGLVAPFTLRSTGAGYGSAVAGEKGRAELWLPVWDAPATLGETEMLFREGRLQVGRHAARTGLDGARAAAELGVARGIGAFERFSILERAGQSNLAVPAGRIEVRERPAARALGTLDLWLARVISHAGNDIPHAQREAIGALERAAFGVAQHGASADVRALLVALGRIEGVFSMARESSRPKGIEPISPTAEPWIAALDTAIIEVRLAIGFASVADRVGMSSAGERLPALRDYLHATGRDDRGRRRYGQTTPGSVPLNAGVVERLAAAHARRHQDAARTERTDLGFDRGIGVALADLSLLVSGRVDERELGALVDGLALLDHRGVPGLAHGVGEASTEPLLGILALAFHDPRPAQAAGEPRPCCRPRIGWVARLRAGRVREVTQEALLRLRLSDRAMIAAVDDLQTARASGRQFAAALLAHPRRNDLWRVAGAATLAATTHEHQETAR